MTTRVPSILIVHPDRKTQRIVQRILGGTGYTVDIADDLDQGTRLIAHLQPVLVVIDGSAVMSRGIDEFFAAAKSRGAEACMTLLGGAAVEIVGDVDRVAGDAEDPLDDPLRLAIRSFIHLFARFDFNKSSRLARSI